MTSASEKCETVKEPLNKSNAPSPLMGEGWGEGEKTMYYPSPQPSPAKGEGVNQRFLVIKRIVSQQVSQGYVLSLGQDKVGRRSKEKMGYNSNFLIISDRFSKFPGKLQKACA